MSTTDHTPRWVQDAISWPTPNDCRAMSKTQAERLIRAHVDIAVAAQIAMDGAQARRDRATVIARRIAAVHPKAAARVERLAGAGMLHTCPDDVSCPLWHPPKDED